MGKSIKKKKKNSMLYVHTHEGGTPRLFIAGTGTRITFYLAREFISRGEDRSRDCVLNGSRVLALLSPSVG